MRPVTQLDIAKKLGVSRQAVGYAIGHHPEWSISLRPETRQRILDTAGQLGYRPHRYAQIMRSRKSGIMGMIQPGGFLQTITERAFFAAKEIHAVGYQLLTTDVLWYGDGIHMACNTMLDSRVEGVLLAGPSRHYPPSELDRLQQAGIPMVALSGAHFPSIPQVRADVRQGMFDLTTHLLRVGYRRLVLLTMRPLDEKDDQTDWPVKERIAGFRDAISRAGSDNVEAEVICEDSRGDPFQPHQIGKDAMNKLLQRDGRPQAVLCHNDDWALGALAACAELDLWVPDDFAVTGFDNAMAAQVGMVPLTTVAQPNEALAKKAVELLVRTIRGEKLSASEELIKMPCAVVVRQSSGGVRVAARARQAGNPGN